MPHITGIGGMFFKSDDNAALAAWDCQPSNASFMINCRVDDDVKNMGA
jgi:hypothetical protein